MPRPSKQSPDRGDARRRLLDAARDLFREKGFTATSVDDLCRRAEVTKGAFFHHFAGERGRGRGRRRGLGHRHLGLLRRGPYHLPADPVDRVLAYVAFRREMIAGEMAAFTCVAGTLAQEMHDQSPAIRDACGAAILGHAASLEADIAAALAQAGAPGIGAASLARYTQAAIQGAFILAKAGNDPALAREALDHLDRYLRLILHRPTDGAAP